MQSNYTYSAAASSTSSADWWRAYYTNTAALLLKINNYGDFYYFLLIIVLVFCGQPVVIYHAARGKLGVSKKVALAYSAIGINEIILVLSNELTYFLQVGLLQAANVNIPVLIYPVTCKLLNGFWYYSEKFDGYYTLWICIERLIAIRRPFLTRKYFTYKRSIIAVLLISLICILLSLEVPITFQTTTTLTGFSCVQNVGSAVVYYTRIVTYLAPAVLSLFVNAALARALTTAGKQHQGNADKKHKASKSARSFLIISALHVFMYTPHCVAYTAYAAMRANPTVDSSLTYLVLVIDVTCIEFTQLARISNLLVVWFSSPGLLCKTVKK